MADPILHRFPDLDTLSAAAADAAAELVLAAPADRPFGLVLAGGSTPRRFHERLVAGHADTLPWERIHLFWGDERFVDYDHTDSNYRMARETLLEHVPIPEANLHPMLTTSCASPDEAARAYEAELRRFFGDRAPAFDLVLLGLGDDGHTASLFPGTAALDETERWVSAGRAPVTAASRERVTLTFPLLNRSRNIFFLVGGAAKREPVRAILDAPDAAAARFPAARIRPDGAVHWFVDAAAYGSDAP